MMFNYSLSTVYMTILTSNLLLILIACFFRNNKVMINLGYRLLAVFVCLTFIRFLLPFEFSFTTTLIMPPRISLIIVGFLHPIFYISSIGINLWTLLELAWLIGILVYTSRYIREIRMAKRYILIMGNSPKQPDRYTSILDDICKIRGKKNHFRILEIENLDSPKIYGIIKPYILLPKDISFSDKDIYYILGHEATHHFHHDILLKELVRILSIIYWWNPACHALNKQVNLLLEMRIDDSVTTSSDTMETSRYLGCLLSIAERSQKYRDKQNALALSFSQLDKKILTKRFEMLINREKPRNTAINVIICIAILFIYIVSYFIILEPYYQTLEVESTISITEDSSYFIRNEDGTYDLYYSGIFFETVTSLEYFSSDIPIYTQEEFQQLTKN